MLGKRSCLILLYAMCAVGKREPGPDLTLAMDAVSDTMRSAGRGVKPKVEAYMAAAGMKNGQSQDEDGTDGGSDTVKGFSAMMELKAELEWFGTRRRSSSGAGGAGPSSQKYYPSRFPSGNVPLTGGSKQSVSKWMDLTRPTMGDSFLEHGKDEVEYQGSDKEWYPPPCEIYTTDTQVTCTDPSVSSFCRVSEDGDCESIEIMSGVSEPSNSSDLDEDDVPGGERKRLKKARVGAMVMPVRRSGAVYPETLTDENWDEFRGEIIDSSINADGDEIAVVQWFGGPAEKDRMEYKVRNKKTRETYGELDELEVQSDPSCDHCYEIGEDGKPVDKNGHCELREDEGNSDCVMPGEGGFQCSASLGQYAICQPEGDESNEGNCAAEGPKDEEEVFHGFDAFAPQATYKIAKARYMVDQIEVARKELVAIDQEILKFKPRWNEEHELWKSHKNTKKCKSCMAEVNGDPDDCSGCKLREWDKIWVEPVMRAKTDCTDATSCTEWDDEWTVFWLRVDRLHQEIAAEAKVTEFTMKACDETMSGVKDAGYRGCQTMTRSGRTCQKWTSQSPHEQTRTPSNYPNLGLGNHSFCRNPDGEDAIWCYTTSSSHRWEYCDPVQGCVDSHDNCPEWVDKCESGTQAEKDWMFQTCKKTCGQALTKMDAKSG